MADCWFLFAFFFSICLFPFGQFGIGCGAVRSMMKRARYRLLHRAMISINVLCGGVNRDRREIAFGARTNRPRVITSKQSPIRIRNSSEKANHKSRNYQSAPDPTKYVKGQLPAATVFECKSALLS